MERLFDPDATINYFSEFLGILITVILIPIAINIYDKRKKKSKRHLAEKILMTKINMHLDKLTPKKFRNTDNGTIWINKRLSRIKIFVFEHILPFSINASQDKIEKHFRKSFVRNNNPKKLEKLYISLVTVRDDLQNYFSLYIDVVNKSILSEFYKLDYNIHTVDLNFKKYEEDDIYVYSETIAVVIVVLDSMRTIMIKNYKEIDPEYLKDLYNNRASA